MDKDNWVDFKAIKAAVALTAVLERYQVNWLRKKDDELRGRCPIHKGEGQGAFHVNVVKGVFHCFSCKKRGNVLDFVAAMEQCSIRDAALKLKEWFSVSDTAPTAGGRGSKPSESKFPAGEGEEPMVNKPLAFQLKGIDPSHPYLAGRSITKETAETFGVGFFSGRGSMAGRVAIPIRNKDGELVAYAGRSIDSTEPRYKLPMGFHKSVELYNLNRVEGDEVIVVEGFFDAMQVHQAGFAGVVALMGSSLSNRQEKLLIERFRRVTLLLDGDEAGRKAAEEIAARLVRRLYVRIVELPDGKQPDGMSREELQALLL